MATSFLSSSDQSWFEEAVDTWFETFKNPIVVHKEPIKNIVQNTTDLSIASIAWWLRSNIGDLNITINKSYTINETTLEIKIPDEDSFGNTEKSIFKMLFSIHYYERLLRNALGAVS